MDPLQPIILQPSDSPAVHALTRVDRTHPDGRGTGGQGGRRQKRRQEDQGGDLDLQASHRDLEDAVEVQLDGIPPDATETAQTPAPPALPLGDDGRPHIDLTA
jgi:hypothetical protein